MLVTLLRKKITTIAAGFLLLGAVIAIPAIVHAQADAPPIIAADEAREARLEAKRQVENRFGFIALSTLLNSFTGFVNRIAYEAAVRVASSGAGQKPLVHTQNFGDFIKDSTLDATTDFLNDISKNYTKIGLCDPGAFDPRVALRIKLGIAESIKPAPPKCTFNEFTRNIETFKDTLTSGEFLKNLSVGFEQGQSPLGAALSVHFGALNGFYQKQSDATLERLEGQGFKALTDPITGRIKTPAAVVQETLHEATIRKGSRADDVKTAAIFTNSDIYKSLFLGASNIFLSTLTSKLIERYLTNGAFNLADVVCKTRTGEDLFDLCKQAGKTYAGSKNGGETGGAALARAQFASLLTVNVSSIDNYAPVNILASCPDQNRQPFNCVLDQRLAGALTPQADGSYLTVRQAIAQGILNGGWSLIPPTDVRNQDAFCYTNGYCYENLVKMRISRIVPVGWEMAALKASTAPVTLKQAMDAFYDETSTYFHLIDPDWVLKIPATQCRAQVRGQTLVTSQGAERAESCVDAPTCISEDGNGNCTGGYGYCTREKNSWRIPGASCPAQFASCEGFKNTENDKEITVVKNTTESRACTAQNAGCRWFATTQTGSAWSTNPADRIYLNNKAPTCNQENAGCTALENLKTVSSANRLQNPSFEMLVGAGGVANWSLTGNLTTNGSQAYDGFAAPSVSVLSQESIQAEENQLYTLSFFAKGNAGGQGSAYIEFLDAEGKPLQDGSATALNCSGDGVVACSTVSLRAQAGVRFNTTTGYSRYTVEMASPPGTRQATLTLNASGTVYVDAFQFERSPTATGFHVAGFDNSGSVTRLKVAPDYLKCTGDPKTDVVACASYAPVCRETEVGCDAYSPVAGGAQLTAVTSSGDRCSAECVGYETFKQERTIWEGSATDVSRIPIYFIPKTAVQCSVDEIGCDEFTNVEAAGSGGEAREYYTAIRVCAKPDATSDTTYYAWEGSDQSGYQLKTFTMRRDADGGPALVSPSLDSLGCSANLYRLPQTDAAWNPDCRELYDAAGKIYYRLLSRTIISSDSCRQLRKTNSNEQDCRASGGTWEAATASCRYLAYAPESRSCSREANGCRAFTGNNGGNVRIISLGAFEGGSTDAWGGGVIANEATLLNGHSLAVGVNQSITRPLDGMLQRSNSYTFTFWAKGSGSPRVTVGNGTDGKIIAGGTSGTEVRLDAEWKRYSLGPVFIDWAPGPADKVSLTGFGAISYLDNFELREATNQFTVIKNSWNTPAKCDATVDGIPLPQAQLGCAEYQNKAGQTVTLKSFDHLCRVEAVGCQAFIDRRNNTSAIEQTFNARCVSTTRLANATDCTIGGKTVCTVKANENFCRFNWNGIVPQGALIGGASASITTDNADTVSVPADTVRNLIDDQKYRCDADAVGCTALGESSYGKLGTCKLAAACNQAGGCPCGPTSGDYRPTSSDGRACTVPTGATTCQYTYNQGVATGATTYRKIEPDSFDTHLCGMEALGCEQWTTATGGTAYFKDPGDQLCEYRENVNVRGINTNGWFKRGSEEPCDPLLSIGGTQWGIWRNSDSAYAGLTGMCKQEFAGCTEFLDPNDTSSSFPQGRPYYAITDERLTTARDECKGQVSQKDGCIAFQAGDNPLFTFSAQASYAKSNSLQSRRVDAVDCSKPLADRDPNCIQLGGGIGAGRILQNNANVILKVNQDRICSQWAECAVGQSSVDPTTGKETTRCLGLGLCIKKGANGQCVQWSTSAANKLTTDSYVRRNVGFSGEEYSGFSIPNQYPIDLWKQKYLTTIKNYILRPSTVTGTGIGPEDRMQICRAYPEPESPFPKTVLDKPNGDAMGARKQQFAKTNVCEQDGSGCDCSYRKAQYGGATVVKYYALTAEQGYKPDGKPGEIAAAICSGGSFDGQACDPVATGDRTSTNLTCKVGQQEGVCESITRVDTVLGQKGYCLEEDPTFSINGSNEHACLSYLPIDGPSGKDITNQYVSAAFIPKPGEERYCAGMLGFCANDTRKYCSSSSDCTGGASCVPIKELATRDVEYSERDRDRVWRYQYGQHIASWSADQDLNTDQRVAFGVNTVLRFEVQEGSVDGPWYSLFNRATNFYFDDNGNRHADEYDRNVTPPRLARVLDVLTHRQIGGYPSDLLGAYASEALGEAIVTYKLVYPQLILESQLEDVRIGVISDEHRIYNECEDTFTIPLLVIGGAAALAETYSQDAWNRCHGNGGYTEFDTFHRGLEYSTPKKTDASSFSDWFAVLTKKNGWTVSLSGGLNEEKNTAQFKAVFSDTEPKRLLGIEVSTMDVNDRGIFYVFGANVHLNDRVATNSTDKIRAPACGVAAYIGSSNPASDKPAIALTNRVNDVVDFTKKVANQNDDPNNTGGAVIRGENKLIRYDYSCKPWGAFRYTTPATVAIESQGTKACSYAQGAIYEKPIENFSLRRLFARSYSELQFIENEPLTMASVNPNETPFSYSRTIPNRSGWDDVSHISLPVNNIIESGRTVAVDPAETFLAPTVRSASCDPNSGKCSEAIDRRFSVNGIDGGLILGRGSLPVSLKFFAWADSNRMPIRSVKVDWDAIWANGNEIDPGDINFFKNHRQSGTCNEDQARKAGQFGLHPNACDDSGPFTYTYVYQYDPASQNCNWTADKDYPSIGLKAGQRACRFVPRIQVKDNWSWCTADTARGLYGEFCVPGIPGRNPWIDYSGAIIVAPPNP